LRVAHPSRDLSNLSEFLNGSILCGHRVQSFFDEVVGPFPKMKVGFQPDFISAQRVHR
jgi:hypothetical protein